MSFYIWCSARLVMTFICLKPRANGRNIVGQQLLTLLDVTCCVRLYTLLQVIILRVVGSCCATFETGQTFSPVQTNAAFLANNSQHFRELLRPFARRLTVLRPGRINNR